MKLAHELAVLGEIDYDYPAAKFFSDAFGSAAREAPEGEGGGGEIVPGLTRDRLREEIAAAFKAMASRL